VRCVANSEKPASSVQRIGAHNGLVISGKRQINLGLARHLAKHGELKVKADAPLELKQAIFTKLRNAWPMNLLSQLRQDS
jgi:hypothetical protein